MRPLARVLPIGGCLVGLPACDGDPCPDTQEETASGACEPSTGNTDTDSIHDTDTSIDPKDAGTLTAEVTPGVGDPYTFVAEAVSGGFAEYQPWTFTARGPAASDFLAFEVAGSPGTGDYPIGTPEDNNFALYSDLTNLGSGAVLGSSSGSVTVSRWEAAYYELGEAYIADGTFELGLSDGAQPTPLVVTMTGVFTDMWMVGDAYQSR